MKKLKINANYTLRLVYSLVLGCSAKFNIVDQSCRLSSNSTSVKLAGLCSQSTYNIKNEKKKING